MAKLLRRLSEGGGTRTHDLGIKRPPAPRRGPNRARTSPQNRFQPTPRRRQSGQCRNQVPTEVPTPSPLDSSGLRHGGALGKAHGVPTPAHAARLHRPHDITAIQEAQQVREYQTKDADRLRTVLGVPPSGPGIRLVKEHSASRGMSSLEVCLTFLL